MDRELQSTSPRPLTPLAARRAWNEPHCRAWWLAAIVLLIVMAAKAGAQYLHWNAMNRAVRSGVMVDAKIEIANDDNRAGQRVTAASEVALSYDHAGKKYRKTGTLLGRNEFITVGSTVPIHIDPGNPNYWTYASVLPSLGSQMVVVMLLFPVFLVCLLRALWLHTRVKSTWKHGVLRTVSVIGSGRSVLAPRCQAITCAPDSQSARLVLKLFLPPSAQPVAAGEIIEVLVAQRKTAMAAAWFTLP